MRTEDDEDQITVVIFLSCLRLLFECMAIPARVYGLSVFCWFEAASDESTTFLHNSFHFVDHSDTMIELIRSLLKNKRFHVEMSGKRNRLSEPNNGLPRGSVLQAPILFLIYTKRSTDISWH